MEGQAIAPILTSIDRQQDRGWGMRHAPLTHILSLTQSIFIRHIYAAETAMFGKAAEDE